MTDLITKTQPYELLIRWDEFDRLSGAHFTQAIATVQPFSADQIAAMTAEAEAIAADTGEAVRPVALGKVVSFAILQPQPVTDVSGDGDIMDELLGIVAGDALRLAAGHKAECEALSTKVAKLEADLRKAGFAVKTVEADLTTRDEAIAKYVQAIVACDTALTEQTARYEARLAEAAKAKDAQDEAVRKALLEAQEAREALGAVQAELQAERDKGEWALKHGGPPADLREKMRTGSRKRSNKAE